MSFLAAATGCLIWIPVAAWSVALVQWAIGGEISFLQWLLGMYVVVGLGILAIAPKDPRLAPLSFAAMVGGTVAFPFVRAAIHARERRGVELDVIRKAYTALGQRPQDGLARLRLAEGLYDLGHAVAALAVAETALHGLDKTLFSAEHRRAAGWRAALTQHPRPTPRAVCGRCRAATHLGEPFCPDCGEPWLLRMIGGTMTEGSAAGRKVFSAWLGMLAVVVAVPVTPTLPWPWGFVALAVAVAAAVGMVAWAFLGERD